MRRPIAELLADALHLFSLDLCGLVAEYVACGPPTVGAVPRLLMAFAPPRINPGPNCFCIACNPADGRFWLASACGVFVYDSELCLVAEACRDLESGLAASSVAFDSNGDIFIGDCVRGRIVVCDSSGNVKRTFGSKLNGTIPDDGEAGTAIPAADQFAYISGVCVDGKGLVFVLDRDRKRDCVRVFRRDFSLVRSWGTQPM